MSAVQEVKTIMNVHEAAEYLGISYTTLYKWSCYRKIKRRKINGCLRFHRDDLDGLGKEEQNVKNVVELSRFQQARQRVSSLKTERMSNSPDRLGGERN